MPGRLVPEELDQAAPVRRSLLSNTRAYSQSPYGVHGIYLESTTVRSTTVLTRYMYVPHRGAALAVRDRRGRPFDTFGSSNDCRVGSLLCLSFSEDRAPSPFRGGINGLFIAQGTYVFHV